MRIPQRRTLQIAIGRKSLPPNDILRKYHQRTPHRKGQPIAVEQEAGQIHRAG